MSVVTVAQAKTHLNITTATHDAELQVFIDGCEASIAEKTGPLTSVATTERVRGGGTGLVVRETPIVSLTSVTPVNGSAYDVTKLVVDNSAGVLQWLSGATFATGWYDVVYQAGRSTLPADLKLAILDFIRDNWKGSQRGPTRRPGGQPSEAVANTIPGAAYSYSFAVMQKLQPHIQVGN